MPTRKTHVSLLAARHEALSSPSVAGLTTQWHKLATTIYSPQVLEGLPPFAERLAKTFWMTEKYDAVDAIHNGDPAFFVACQLRLDLIDQAAIAAGYTIAERSPIVRARWILDGFQQAAEEALLELGGSWPPTQIKKKRRTRRKKAIAVPPKSAD